MAGVQLKEHQYKALQQMKNGCILKGTVGSGKSRTALAYYYEKNGGKCNYPTYVRMLKPKDLYIITTAMKRDKLEWEEELLIFHMSTNPDPNLNWYKNKVVVDSWNNIEKYKDVKDAFFIFDEQRAIGYGAWAKAFITIAKSNEWILLSATPGDVWEHYISVFIANGFYKNKTDFIRQHFVYSAFTNFPKVERVLNEGKLIRLKNSILVTMEDNRDTIPHHEIIMCNYDRYNYEYITRNRWNIYKNKPIETANEFCLTLRQLVNSDLSRQEAVLDILKQHHKVIIFYNYNYELDILKALFKDVYPFAEWNGHAHQQILSGPKWAYLVQYTAGKEGWNCVTTDTEIFYSQNYSYSVMVQAAGRINRMNTPFKDLYYYHLKSSSKIDKAINMSLNKKKKFNEKTFAPDFDNSHISHAS